MHHVRVVVQLCSNYNDVNVSNNQSIEENSSRGQKHGALMRTEVQLIDFKTVQVSSNEVKDTFVSQTTEKMSFDYVGHSSENRLKTEISLLMDELLIHQRNCCLVRFSSQRKCHLAFLYNLLIAEVNKHFKQLDATVEFIKVEFKNVLNGEAKDENANRSDCSFQDRFTSTRELLLWLLNDYRLKFADQAGHESFGFHFFAIDKEQRQFNVKFSLLNVFLDRMHAASRLTWHSFVKQVGNSNECNDFDHSSLTFELRHHLKGLHTGRTLLLFEVPTDSGNPADTVELLKMAHVVIVNRCNKGILNTPKRLYRKRAQTLELLEAPTAISFTIPIESKCKRARLMNSDFNCLGTWFRRIHEKSESAREAFKNFYEKYVDLQIACTRQDIKNVYNFSEIMDVCHSSKPTLKDVQDDLRHYKNTVENFKGLTEEINTTNYSEILKIYMETKGFELSQEILKLKIKQLQNFRKILNSTLDEEISDLSVMLFNETEVQASI